MINEISNSTFEIIKNKNSEVVFIVNADSGFYFDPTSKIKLFAEGGWVDGEYIEGLNVTVEPQFIDEFSCLVTYEYTGNIDFSLRISKPLIKGEPNITNRININVTPQLTNCSITNSPFVFNKDYIGTGVVNYIKIDVKADLGYIFTNKNIADVEYMNTWDNWNMVYPKKIDDRNYVLYCEINVGVDYIHKLILKCTGIDPNPPQPTKYTITEIYDNCTSDNTLNEVDENTDVKIIISCIEGYKFIDPVTLKIGDSITTHNNFINGDTQIILNFKATGNIVINAKGMIVKVLNGFTNLYKVNVDILNSISKERIYIGNEVYPTFDYGQYINNLYSLPFDLNPEFVSNKQRIKLGSLLTETQAEYITNNILNIDLGVITVPLVYNNKYDFINTECKLYVPYFEVINIPIDYVIGYDIKIELVIDLYKSNATLNIISSATNKVIITSNSKVGLEIPFITTHPMGNITGSIGSAIINTVTTPYIEVIRNTPVSIDNPFGNDCFDIVTLQKGMGYIEITKSLLEIPYITPNELNEIKSLLNSGIII